MVLSSILRMQISSYNVALSKLVSLLASIFLPLSIYTDWLHFASLLHAEWLWVVVCLTSALFVEIQAAYSALPLETT